MLTALDRDTPQAKDGLTPHFLPHQEPNTFQELPWLWFTLPELGFPLLMDEYRRPIHGIHAKTCFRRPRLGTGR